MAKIDKVNKLVEKGKTDKLLALVYDKDKEVRLAAIKGLRSVPETEDSVNTLVAMINDTDTEIRKEVIISLGYTQDSYVETQLRHRLVAENDDSVKAAIRESLDRMRAAGVHD
ncbi:MAG: HEAT repeat domain-containing protein [Lachnospiraceae bacterium]|nr:HEAT repeat domain-containing protein [Lachnospiraceae bacterium]